MTVAEVMLEVEQDRVFYDSSDGGVTFSGGEPLLQPQFLTSLLEACRERELHTTVDTCGLAPEQDLLNIAPLTDLFLYDLKIMDDKRHIEYTGASNAPILRNLQALARVHRNIWLRVPVIPGINDAPEDLDALARLAASLTSVQQVNLLAYHDAGAYKSMRVGKAYKMGEIEPPSPARMEEVATTFRTRGVNVRKGG
jgi:pyruvate formate lyase activating enzyme